MNETSSRKLKNKLLEKYSERARNENPDKPIKENIRQGVYAYAAALARDNPETNRNTGIYYGLQGNALEDSLALAETKEDKREISNLILMLWEEILDFSKARSKLNHIQENHDIQYKGLEQTYKHLNRVLIKQKETEIVENNSSNGSIKLTPQDLLSKDAYHTILEHDLFYKAD